MNTIVKILLLTMVANVSSFGNMVRQQTLTECSNQKEKKHMIENKNIVAVPVAVAFVFRPWCLALRDLAAFAVFGLFLGLGTVIAATGEPQSAGTATGVLTIDGKSLELKHAYAMSQPNVFHKEKNDVAVLLTAAPLPAGALQGKESLSDVISDLHGWALFKIDEKGSAIGETIDHPSLGNRRLMMSGFTYATLVVKSLGKDRIEGSFKTETAESFNDHKYEINVSFDAPIVQATRPEPLPNAKTGQALAADGGEPGKAFLAFIAAIHKKDLAAIRRMIPQGDPNIKDEDELAFIAKMTPNDVKIEKGYLKDDRAVLYVKGTVEHEKTWGTIEMVKKDGRWWQGRMSWSDKPHNE
jgi:hypothetical protein